MSDRRCSGTPTPRSSCSTCSTVPSPMSIGRRVLSKAEVMSTKTTAHDLPACVMAAFHSRTMWAANMVPEVGPAPCWPGGND
eukprot:13578602-Alexandrium_andersonii.AAC.1